jgi:Bacterial Ig-like domain (group 3)
MFFPNCPGRHKRDAGTTRSLASRSKRGRFRRRSLTFEAMEGRTLLSTYTVDSLGDSGTGSDFIGDMRYAITQANSNAGSTIQFSVTGTIQLGSSLPALSQNVTITGPGTSSLTIQGGGSTSNYNAFSVNSGVTATISGLTIANFHVTGNGGGIYNDGTLALTNDILSGNSAYGGGGILNGGTATLTDCTVSGNSAMVNGAGMANYGGTATLTDCTISGNSASDGGGLSTFGLATLTDCTISGNSIDGNGGGLRNTGTAMLTDCTISGNSAGNTGGVSNYGTATLTDCTISGNSALNIGGVLNEGTATLTDCTISGNSADNSGGIVLSGYTATLTNTIVASNAAGGVASDIIGQNITGSYNLIGTGGSGALTPADHNLLNIADPLLSPSGDYGGLTETIALLPGSPAIGAGIAVSGVTTDQRGEPPDTPNPDIGAYQSQGFVLTQVNGSTPQTTPPGTTFANPLAVIVTANDPGEPVDGGIVTFTVNRASNGSSASLSSTTATIGANGIAEVSATANATGGSYTVAASTSGGAAVDFAVKNLLQLNFSGVVGQSITYGTSSVTVTGTLADGSQAPSEEDVAVKLSGVTQLAAIGSGGAFSSTFTDTASLTVTGSPYTISYTYTSDGTFASASTTSSLTVTKATPTIAWTSPADITFGTALSTTQLDATASVPGTFTYTPAAGTVLNAGANQTLSVSFMPTDTTDFTTAAGTATINVDKATPTIAWANPADITYGTALTGTQLDASANAPGSFTYTSAADALLVAGSGETLSATFTPQDLTDYITVTATTTITVEKATPTLKLSDPGGTYDGSPFPASVTITGSGADNSPAASLEGVTPTLTYYDGSGTSGPSLGSTPPTAAGTHTAVASFAGSADYSAVQSAPFTFTIGVDTAAIALASSTGSAVYGQPITFVATVAADITPSGTVTFLDGGTTLATVALDGSGTATLITSTLAPGSHSITANYSGDADFGGAQFGSASESVGQSGTTIVLVPHPVLKKKKVVSEVLTAKIEPMFSGGFPTGMVTFELLTKKGKKIHAKNLGTAAVRGGYATLTVGANLVLSQTITILYSGDADFLASTVTTPKLSKNGL